MTPVKASIAATVFNIALSLWLVFYAGVGVIGIAAATALAGWLQLYLLARGLKGQGETKIDDRFKRNFVKIGGGCLLMAAYLYAAQSFVKLWVFGAGATLFTKIAAVGVLVGGGALVYGLAVVLMGVIDLKEFKRYFTANKNTTSSLSSSPMSKTSPVSKDMAQDMTDNQSEGTDKND